MISSPLSKNYANIAIEVREKVSQLLADKQNGERALAYVRQTVQDLISHKVPVEKLIIQTKLQKELEFYKIIPPHVAAAVRVADARMREGSDKAVGAGSLIEFVIVKGEGELNCRARLPEEITKDDYDEKYYIWHHIIPAIEELFEEIGYNVRERFEKELQTKLGSYL